MLYLIKVSYKGVLHWDYHALTYDLVDYSATQN